MTFPELMSAIRASYAEVLSAALSVVDRGRREGALRHPDGSLGIDGTPPLPHRVDFVGDDGVARTVDATRQLRFEPFEFELEGMAVSVAPFTWDWVVLEITGDAALASQVAADWFLRWFDVEDERESDAQGLRGIVHYMGDPQPVDGGIELRIDLGSAADESVDDLLFSLAEAGMSAARLHA